MSFGPTLPMAGTEVDLGAWKSFIEAKKYVMFSRSVNDNIPYVYLFSNVIYPW
jgi:hypothetical protein